MFSVVSIVECPICGGFVLVSDLGSSNEPPLQLVKCEICDTRLQVKYNKETKEVIVEEVKMG